MRKIDRILPIVRPGWYPTPSHGPKPTQLHKGATRDSGAAQSGNRGLTESNQRDEATNGLNTCKD